MSLLQFLLVVCIAALVRIISYDLEKIIEPVGAAHLEDYELYRQALTQHFWEYFLYAHTVTPLSYLHDWVVFNFFSSKTYGVVNFLFLSAIDSLAAGFVFLTLKNFKIPILLSIISAIFLSLRLVSWDLINASAWDYYNPFLFSLLFFCLSTIVANSSIWKYLVLGSIGALVLTSFQPASAVVFSTLVIAVFVVSVKRKVFSRLLAVLSPPVLILSLMILKTGLQHGIYAPTTGMGHGFVQNLSLSVFDPYNKKSILDFAKEKSYPSWWVWCFKNAEGLNSNWGNCRFKRDASDFTDLKQYLIKNKFFRLLKIVSQDEKVFAEKPWLYSGRVTPGITRWNVEFGKVSSNLLRDVVFQYPWGYLVRSYTNFKYFIFNGAQYEFHDEQVEKRVSVSIPNIVHAINYGLTPVIFVSILFCFFILLLYPTQVFLSAVNEHYAPPSLAVGLIWAMCIGFGFGIAVSIFFSCCNQWQHAFNYLTIIWVVGTFCFYQVVLRINRIRYS